MRVKIVHMIPNEFTSGSCGFNRKYNKKVCCKSVTLEGNARDYFDSVLSPGDKCYFDSECDNGYCSGNDYGAKEGECYRNCSSSQYHSGPNCVQKKIIWVIL